MKTVQELFKSRSAAGLEIVLKADGSCLFHVLVLEKRKNEITPVLQKSVGTLEEAAALIGKKLPFVLVISGKGVLYKKVNGEEQDPLPFLLAKVLPNGSPSDFCLQLSQVDVEQLFVSVIRKETLEKLSDDLRQQGLLSLSGCFLGPFALNALLPVLDEKYTQGTLQAGELLLETSEARIQSLQPSAGMEEEPVMVGTESVSPAFLNAFASAFSFFAPAGNGVLNSALINDAKEEFREKKKFEARGLLFLLSVFIIVIINYLVFDHYRQAGDVAEEQLALHSSSLQRYNTLKQEYDRKKEFLERNGLLSSARSSFYADRLARDLPAEIRWTELYIHPLEKKKNDEDEKQLSFQGNAIIVAGNCRQSTGLNEWMKEIRKNSWVKDVALMNYTQDQLRDEGSFLLKIELK